MPSVRKGLSEAEAAVRFQKYGPNELPRPEKVGFLRGLVRTLREPMLLFLLAIALLYFFMGDHAEGLALCVSAAFVIGIAYFQDAKAEHALEALRSLSSPRALVIRDSVARRLAARDVVPGDLVALQEGDRIPVDGVVLESSHFSADESLLTGEAFSVEKQALPANVPIEDCAGSARIFMGSLSVRGNALAQVTSTGTRTEMGKIGKALQMESPNANGLLAREVRLIVQVFAWAGGFLCALIVLLFGFLRGDWPGGLLAGLSTAMALLPEEFPVVLTVFLAVGAWRLSRTRVLVRRPQAMERLGAITVLCVDKTGTITENRMSVAAFAQERKILRITSGETKFPDEFHDLMLCARLASRASPFDPMDKAIHAFADKNGFRFAPKDLVREYPLSKELFATTFVWRSEMGSLVAAAKGAPETMLRLCRLDEARECEALGTLKKLTGEGLRVLGVARAVAPEGILPDTQNELRFEWLGLIGFEDPVRAEVPAAMRSCHEAGIRILMITGDYPATALKVAESAGIEISAGVLTGAELERLSEADFVSRLKTVNVFARMKPEQKLRIVHALQASKEVVGMTGDGVNDAPSLKTADVGIAMGARGTDVAREAAGIVLTDDNFASIVAGIERGRSIFANLKKSMGYIVSIHVPLAGLAVLPLLLGGPMIFLPIHIALLELIIDPSCSLLFEAQDPEANTMREPPRPVSAPVLSPKDYLRSAIQGVFAFVLIAAFYATELRVHGDAGQARAVAFVLFGLCNIGLIVADLTNGSLRELSRLFRKRIHLGLLAGTIAVQIVLTQIPAAARLFNFSVLAWDDLGKIGLWGALFFVFVSGWNNFSGSRLSPGRGKAISELPGS